MFLETPEASGTLCPSEKSMTVQLMSSEKMGTTPRVAEQA